MRSARVRPLLPRILADLGDAQSLSAAVSEPENAVPLSSNLPVSSLAQDSVDAAALQAAATVMDRTGSLPPVRSDPRRIAAAYSSERWFRIDDVTPSAWAPLSGFWAASDGWVRTHGNYPHHAERLRTALGLQVDAGADELRERAARSSAAEIADTVTNAGGIAVVVARPNERAARAAATRALVESELVGGGEPRSWHDGGTALGGIRVLDLTRVIAGPVATRTLGLFGADVLRIDSPGLPEIGWQHLDTGAGKRSALLDLADSSDRLRFEDILADADVVVLGYRPAAVERLGLSPAAIAARHPGIVIGRLTAWGFSGSDAQRRGFDSIVQAASGISWIESADGITPGALPAQALDHSAGYLLAAGIMSRLRRQRAEGGSHAVSVSLSRVASELVTLPRIPRAEGDPGLADQTQEFATEAGLVRSVRPAPRYDGSPDAFAAGPHPWGTDRAEWLPR
ncbi:CoA transferase [Leifsonia flava]|uniref:CoA transferase n=1 Tax=Orlajensenia leifsoniae TaxID=2561933 RepID=A0A4Y9R0R7_9MICO|nr:CoA transferase [Leifsonia flava]TFV97033.1 CoA transferase [Leifsonia flava]